MSSPIDYTRVCAVLYVPQKESHMTRTLFLTLGITLAAVAWVPTASAYDPCQRAYDQYDVALANWSAWCTRGGRPSCPYPGGPEGQRLNAALTAAEQAIRRECR